MSGWGNDIQYSGGPVVARTRSGSAASVQVSVIDPSPANPKRRDSPGSRVNFSYMLIFAASNVPQQCLGFRVPSGAKVRARAYNGTAAGNAQPCFVSHTGGPNVLTSLQGTPLAPLDDVEFPCDNTARVFAMGTAGDGVVISVISQPEG